MALFRPGVAISDARGSVGGVTFSRNRSGLLMRDRIKPVDPNTPAQAAARDRVRDLQFAWLETLTATQRTSYQALADSVAGTNALGDKIRLTAINHFIQINSLRLAAGEAILTTAPAPPAGTQIPTLVFTGTTAAGLKITSITPALSVGDLLFARVSDAHQVTRNYYKGPWPRFLFWKSTDAAPVTVVASGELAIGQRWFIQCRFLSADGRITGYDNTIFDIAS